jgi:hypothetical protein
MSGVRAAPPLRVRVGGETVDGRDTTAVEAAIGRANAAVRIEGLADELNPSLVDPARALALIAALPDPAAAALGEVSLYLNAPNVPVRPCSPTTPASFAKLEGIEIAEVQGDTALVRVLMQPDCELAKRQAAAAKAAIAAIGADVARLEAVRQASAASDVLHELSAARRRRFAIAGAWYENAAAASLCAPGEAEAAAELAAAQKARGEFAVPTGSLP